MKDLELIFNTKTLCLKMDQSLNEVKNLINPVDTLVDAQLSQIYYILKPKYGFDLMFSEEKLKNIFLYKDRINQQETFSGSLSLLPSDFFPAFEKGKFYSHLVENGFVEHEKKFPYSLDLLNDSLRLRYYDRSDSTYISINDGSQIRTDKQENRFINEKTLRREIGHI